MRTKVITSFEGRMGSGKSLGSTALAYMEWSKREMLREAIACILDEISWEKGMDKIASKFQIKPKTAEGFLLEAMEIYEEEGEETFRAEKIIYSNNHLNFPYKHFDPAFFLEHLEDEELEDCILLLDEAYIYLDSRSTASKMNKLFTYFVAQTRKRGVDLYVCTHHFDVLDKRLRRAIDIRGSCRFNKGPIEEEKPFNRRRYNWATINFRDLRTGGERKIRIYGPPFYPLYNTREKVPLMRAQKEIEL